jgi:hypothetical protein
MTLPRSQSSVSREASDTVRADRNGSGASSAFGPENGRHVSPLNSSGPRGSLQVKTSPTSRVARDTAPKGTAAPNAEGSGLDSTNSRTSLPLSNVAAGRPGTAGGPSGSLATSFAASAPGGAPRRAHASGTASAPRAVYVPRAVSMAPRPSAKLAGGDPAVGAAIRPLANSVAALEEVASPPEEPRSQNAALSLVAFQRPPKPKTTDSSAARTSADSPPRGLAHAFNSALVRSPKPEVAPVRESQWFVAVGDAPQGPLGTAALSELLRSTRVTAESPVWREGFADWVPLEAVAELRGVFDPVATSKTEGGETAKGLVEVDSGGAVPVTTELGPSRAGGACSSRALSSDVVTESAVVEDLGDLELLGIKRRKPGSGAFGPWIAVAAAMVLGLTVGYVTFGQDATVAGAASAARVASGDADRFPHADSGVTTYVAQHTPEPAGPEVVLQAEATVLAARGSDATTRGRGSAAADERSGPVPAESGGLADIRGLASARKFGPAGSETPAIGGAAAGAPLEATDIQLTVGRYKSSVKRGCWEPATSTRTPGSPSTARIELTVGIASSGRVSSVVSSGDPRGYRGLARCIEGRVRGWQFPASGSPTTTRIPFVFATQ